MRAHVARWLTPGDTLVFSQTNTCTAVVFRARSTAIRATLRIESDPNVALYHLKRARVVGLSVPGMTPARATEVIASSDFPLAASVIRAGKAAQPCMNNEFQNAVYSAVQDTNTVLILDAGDISITVLDRSFQRIFYVKGAE